MSLKYIFLNTILILNAIGISARVNNSFNLNIDNGLPVNYTYCLFVDDYGYLWIASTKGVVRYNGYSSKLYNYATGMQKDDIWRFYQDRKKRLWLSTISNQLSYIKNNKYYTINNISKNTLYPIKIIDYTDGVFFVSTHAGPDNYAVWIEKNDTLYAKHIIGIPPSEGAHFLVYGNNIITFTDGTCYVTPIDFSIKDTINPHPIATVNNCRQVNLNTDVISNNIVSFTKNEKIINVINYRNHTQRNIDLGKENGLKNGIQRVALYNDSYHKHQMLAIIATNEVYVTDSSFIIKKTGNLDSLYGKSNLGDKASFFIYDSLWRKCLSTINNGIFINYGTGNEFIKTPVNLRDYKYIGNINDKTAYWWNDDDKTLLRLYKNNFCTKYKTKDLAQVQNIVSYRNDSFILVSSEHFFWFKDKPFTLVPFFPRSKPFGGSNLIVNAPHNFYLISKGRGFSNFIFTKDSFSANNLNSERLNGMVYDSLKNGIWIYKSDDIEVYQGNKLLKSYTADSLKALKINNVEKVCVDNKYGNVFIKEYNRLIVFNNNIRQYKTLFDNYMLNDACICIYKNQLIVAGKFGILFSKINGPSNLAEGLLYPNVKAQVYNYILDMLASDDKVLISTDKGTYTVPIPNDSIVDHVTRVGMPNFRVILSYNDSLRLLQQHDTIAFLKKNLSLQFDIINPTGTGIPQFEYYINGIDSSWHQMNSNELIIPALIPGKYYDIALRIHDDTWKSDTINMRLYLIPNWWQKKIWKNVFFVTGILFVLLFVYLIVHITREMVIRNSRKKNLQLELELKAIYSQINPHFIYNTLSSALLLINNKNTEEAYTHISKFSRLLRSYVKSSKNKYITINEEIVNLKNYIELQQTRFKDKFNYEIVVDGKIDADSVKIPSLLLQPFVENAINHGLIPKKKNGNLMIHFVLKYPNNELICIIEDNGIGRKEAKFLKEGSSLNNESYGNDLIKDLVNIFNKYEKMHIEIKYLDKDEPLSGTIVEIRIKDRKHE